MQFPARYIDQNIVYSGDDNSAWAVLAVNPPPQPAYALMSDPEKTALHQRATSVIMALPQRSMILSLNREIEPSDVEEQMTAGLEDPPEAWQAEVDIAIEGLGSRPAFERRLFIVAALEDTAGSGWRESLAVARAGVGAVFGAIPPPPPAAELERRRREAELLAVAISTAIPVKPVTSGEIRWIYGQATARGLAQPTLDETWTAQTVSANARGILSGPGVCLPVEAVFHEGGEKSEPPELRKVRRRVAIDTDRGISHQSLMAMSDMPKEWVFPGGIGEWFPVLNEMTFPVDWAVRIEKTSNEDARRQTTKKARGLHAQVGEWDGDTAGAPPELAAAAAGLEAQRQELVNSPGASELQIAVIFAVGARDPYELEDRCTTISAHFSAFEYQLPRPTGDQSGLWRSMLPGSKASSACRSYCQHLMPRDLASGAPFTRSAVGDPRGMMLGHTLTSGVPEIVLFDAAYGPTIDRSGSVGVCGSLGSGKSYFAKRICHATLARGGRVVAFDRTATGEYVAIAAAAPGTSSIIQVGNDSHFSVDPLALFGDFDRKRVTVSFLTMLCRISSSDPAGPLLDEAVETVYSRGGRLGEVADELRAIAEADTHATEAAKNLARRLDSFANSKLGQMAFDATRNPIEADADYLVFHTVGLQIPDKAELAKPDDLLPDQVFSTAVLYVLAELARATTFESIDRFSAVLLDEVYWLTSTPLGVKLLEVLVRDGRKHNAAAWLLSQLATDLTENRTLSALLGYRVVFNQGTGAGDQALEFLGVPTTTPNREMVASLGRGMCLIQDVRGQTGLVQVHAARDGLDEAFDTNPERRRQALVAAAVFNTGAVATP